MRYNMASVFGESGILKKRRDLTGLIWQDFHGWRPRLGVCQYWQHLHVLLYGHCGDDSLSLSAAGR
jgi:hypothetical protein